METETITLPMECLGKTVEELTNELREQYNDPYLCITKISWKFNDQLNVNYTDAIDRLKIHEQETKDWLSEKERKDLFCEYYMDKINDHVCKRKGWKIKLLSVLTDAHRECDGLNRQDARRKSLEIIQNTHGFVTSDYYTNAVKEYFLDTNVPIEYR